METLTLKAEAYDKLLALTLWYEAMPEGIGNSFDDSFYESVWDSQVELVDCDKCSSVELENNRLIAIVEDDEGNETRVPIIRG